MLSTASLAARLLRPIQNHCAHARLLLVTGGAKRFSSGSQQPIDQEDIEVVFLDPKLALQPQGSGEQLSVSSLAAQGAICCLRLPHSWGSRLHKAKHELGDMDDPLNAWAWGKTGEIFQYTLVGTHASKSGYTSVMMRHSLEALLSSQQGAEIPAAAMAAPSWQSFQDHFKTSEEYTSVNDTKDPILFAGRVLESDIAAVYVLKGSQGIVEGIMVSSEAAGQN